MASKAHSKDYRQWIDRAEFAPEVQRYGEKLSQATTDRRVDLLAACLRRIAAFYHIRGAVLLLDSNSAGWNDIQAGYLAALNGFVIGRKLGFGLIADLLDSQDYIVEIVSLAGLSRLIGTDTETSIIMDWLEPRFDSTVLVGKQNFGHQILEVVVRSGTTITAEELKQDRITCCRKRSAHPNRITEYEPWGVIDIEMSLTFPESSEFQYPDIPYEPTLNENVSQAISAYHEWTN